ncbi:MAG TPA: hypothetical protein VFP42_10015 [Acidimicrobiia bacterium]|nr:hypothetical protein [Acidimicrobiia bacterium]
MADRLSLNVSSRHIPSPGGESTFNGGVLTPIARETDAGRSAATAPPVGVSEEVSL